MSDRRPAFSPAPMRRPVGMTLIELMIAMALGLVVVGGILSIFVATSETGRKTDELARIQENARIALELMSRSLREADGNACGIGPGSISFVGLDENDWWTGGDQFQNALRGYTASDSFPANAAVTMTEGSDAFIAVSATGGATAVTANSPLTVQSAKGLGQNAAPILFACNNGSGEGFIFKPSADITANEIAATLPKNVDTVAKVHAEAWFVGANPRGGTSLYRSESGNAPEEIAPDVLDMSLGYRLPEANDYVNASAVGSRWAEVVAVRIELTLGRSGENNIERSIAHVVTLRNRSAQP
ncbi:MAG: hypothetical protein LBR95_06435 [Azoarcus sp.]|jgi:type IV pilus assembly protein PilW|nr:hypothetical protein [Azoarcus sp.]